MKKRIRPTALLIMTLVLLIAGAMVTMIVGYASDYYTYTFYYQYEDGTSAHDPYIAVFAKDSEMDRTVKNPIIQGYQPYDSKTEDANLVTEVKLQGEITPGLLDIMHIPYSILTDDNDDFRNVVQKAVEYCKETRRSYGLIAPKGVMADPDKPNNKDDLYPMSREEAIEIILDNMPDNTIYSATTGRATRALFFLREKRNETKSHDYLNVGSMGHASSVALGIAIEKPDRNVVVLDGDSAAIMHLGALTMVSKLDVPNYMHIVLNNGAHESVGGQPSAGYDLDFTSIAKACGYATVDHPVTTEDELVDAINKLKDCKKAGFIDCRIHKGLTRKLPPIIFDHLEAIDSLMDDLQK